MRLHTDCTSWGKPWLESRRLTTNKAPLTVLQNATA